MIVVTGATGKLGRLIVEQLVEHLPADQLGASTRDPGRADGLMRRGVRVRRGDFAEPATLASALYRAARAGEFATVDPTLGALIERTPATALAVG